MNKIIRNKLTKEVQDLDTENCKTLLKDILKDLNNWKNNLCLWFARLKEYHKKGKLQIISLTNINLKIFKKNIGKLNIATYKKSYTP